MIRVFTAAALLAVCATAAGQVQVKDAWVRPALRGQNTTGAFMSLSSADGARLLGISSSAAGVVEIHEMVMDGNVMRMRAVPVLELPAGKDGRVKAGRLSRDADGPEAAAGGR